MEVREGQIQTVLGLVPKAALGSTTCHEHLLKDGTPVIELPERAAERELALAPVTFENLWWVRYNYIKSADNLRFVDLDMMIEEVRRYRLAGGGTIVELTSRGLGRNPLGLAQIARATGVHIVMGAGYYVACKHPAATNEKSEDDFTAEMVEDVVRGVGETGIRSGILGEIGCTWPWGGSEERIVRATARAQRITGAAVSIHPGRHPESPFAILETLRAAGARMEQVAMGHIDRTLFSSEEHLRLLKSGCYIQFDLFGMEPNAVYLESPVDLPSDPQRVDWICRLISEGFLERILVAHDNGTKTKLTRYGGGGYGHILLNVVPMMRRKGLTQDQIDTILVKNPAGLLALRRPEDDPAGRLDREKPRAEP
jgi:phosphotriesterase-related protein